MDIAQFQLVFRSTQDDISFQKVWTIRADELCPAADISSDYIQLNDDLAEMHCRVAWLSQALIEFMDLLDFPDSIRILQSRRNNYFYFEAISALREATVGILNGSFRASTALLRTVFELLLIHCRWQIKFSRNMSARKRENALNIFSECVAGKKLNPKFKDVLQFNVQNLNIPYDVTKCKDVLDVYSKLCSYVHTSSLAESTTILKDGNINTVSAPALCKWLKLAQEVLEISLEHLIFHKPQSLFPVNIVAKFGYNPPVGMYFDDSNTIPLIVSFGEEKINELRGVLESHESVRHAMAIYDATPRLSDEEIRLTWTNSLANQSSRDEAGSSDDRMLLSKICFRTCVYAATYSLDVLPAHDS